MEIGDIYGLLRYLGLSAESTRFFTLTESITEKGVIKMCLGTPTPTVTDTAL